jgi:hypothetical protein
MAALVAVRSVATLLKGAHIHSTQGNDPMIDASEILQGEYDNDLERIETACRQRRKLLRGAAAAVTMASVNVGDTVRIKDIRPKYLIGATAEVTRKRRTKLEIKFDATHRRYRAGTTVIIPSSCVEIVQAVQI